MSSPKVTVTSGLLAFLLSYHLLPGDSSCQASTMLISSVCLWSFTGVQIATLRRHLPSVEQIYCKDCLDRDAAQSIFSHSNCLSSRCYQLYKTTISALTCASRGQLRSHCFQLIPEDA
ncbi:hypothetical protein C8J56DRAFT_253194 [Mycena floridula]|nr:hypothetical protein C8J56DRAFT_253194 [Mycena floridula]